MALQKTTALIADEPYFGYQQLVEYGINYHTVAQGDCPSAKTDYPSTKLNKEPPNLTFRKKEKGGINFTSIVPNTHLDLDTVKAICSEYKIHNADLTLRYDATADDLIDVIEGSRVYMPCIYAVNKIDQITLEELEILDRLPHYCPVGCLYYCTFKDLWPIIKLSLSSGVMACLELWYNTVLVLLTGNLENAEVGSCDHR
nr:PREDICTED: developmentally-regulated G-protein 3-like [Daucus carota subsp. sativus]